MTQTQMRVLVMPYVFNDATVEVVNAFFVNIT
jgi:hypothetical protein